MWHCNFLLIVLSLERCKTILKKFNCTIEQNDLVHLKTFLENWAKIQIEEERNNYLNWLNV